MLKGFLIILLATTTISCTKQEKIDGSSVEAYKKSIDSITSNMTDKEKLQFELGLMGLSMLEMSKDKSGKRLPLIQYRLIAVDGKSKNQILSEIKGIASTPEKYLPKLKNKDPIVEKSYEAVDWNAVKLGVNDAKLDAFARNENPEDVKGLVDYLNYKKDQNLTVNDKFYEAVSWGSYTYIDKFLREGADINSKSNRSESPSIVDATYRSGKYGILMYLLEKGADPDGANKFGCTALVKAVGKKNYIAVEILLANGADINGKGNRCVTPIYNAADRGSAAMVVKLMELGADINIPFSNGSTPLLSMIAKGYNDVAKLLIQNGAQLDNGRVEALAHAKRVNNLEMIEYIKKL